MNRKNYFAGFWYWLGSTFGVVYFGWATSRIFNLISENSGWPVVIAFIWLLGCIWVVICFAAYGTRRYAPDKEEEEKESEKWDIKLELSGRMQRKISGMDVQKSLQDVRIVMLCET